MDANPTSPAIPGHTLIVEDIAATRTWLTALVHDAFPAIGVWHAATLAEARAWVRANPGDGENVLFLIDLGLPDGTGIDLIHELRESHPQAQLVVSTIYDDDIHLLQAMAAGAQSYLLEDRPAEELAELLRRIGHGRDPVAPGGLAACPGAAARPDRPCPVRLRRAGAADGAGDAPLRGEFRRHRRYDRRHPTRRCPRPRQRDHAGHAARRRQQPRRVRQFAGQRP